MIVREFNPMSNIITRYCTKSRSIKPVYIDGSTTCSRLTEIPKVI